MSSRRRELLLAGMTFVALVMLIIASNRLADTVGLECHDYANDWWQEPAFETRIERDLSTPLFATRPARFARTFSTECRGLLTVVRPRTFTMVLWTYGAAQLFLDEQPVLQARGPDLEPASGRVELSAGQHGLRLRYAFPNRGDEPELLMAPEGGALRPVSWIYVSRQPLSRTALLLRPLAWAAPVILPLVWIGFVGYRVRRPLARWCHSIGRPLMHWHRAVVPSTRRSIVTIVVVGIAVRVAVMFATSPILWGDSVQYYETARSFLRGDYLSHNFVSTPIFPAFMAAFLAMGATPAAGAAMIAAQRALAVAASVLVYRVARDAFDKTVAFYAALLWTVSALQLFYETSVTTEALFVVVLVLTLFTADRFLQTSSLLMAAATGVMCAVATLTRPVAKALILMVIAIVVWRGGERRRVVGAAAVLLATFAIAIAPWLYVNRQQYGFWGISSGEGLWLFLRAIDIDELDPPATTRFPAVKRVVDALRPTSPYLHYPVRDELNYHGGYSGLETDNLMWGYAVDTVVEHPVRFAVGTVKQLVKLLVLPYRSVQICESNGPYLCAERAVSLSFPSFPNRPPPDVRQLRVAVVWYIRRAYWILPLVAPIAVIGMVQSLRERDQRTALRTLLIATALYIALATAVFNTVQDRYRLPMDAIVLMFAIYQLRRFTARGRHARTGGSEVPPSAAP